MSTDKQSADSPADQAARCREYAERRGLHVVDALVMVDAGISGAMRETPLGLACRTRVGGNACANLLLLELVIRTAVAWEFHPEWERSPWLFEPRKWLMRVLPESGGKYFDAVECLKGTGLIEWQGAMVAIRLSPQGEAWARAVTARRRLGRSRP